MPISDRSESLVNVLQCRHVYGKYIVNEWNIGGYKSVTNPYNTIFKQAVISNYYSDFWVIPETHSKQNETLDLEYYKMYYYNRVSTRNNRRGSGGIAIAVHTSVLETHTIVGIFKGIDGQLGIKLQNTLNNFLIGVIGFYLSPDSYIYGQDPENFFNEASVIWEDFVDCDLVIGSGDLNSRTKQIIDYLPDIDGNLPERQNPDKTKNSHGNHFLTFLKDNRAVILNGRVTPELNNFTFVCTRGCSVPDYMFCPLDQYVYCKEMKTILIRDVVNNLAIPPPPSLPDHSILSGTFLTSSYIFGHSEKSSFEPFNQPVENKPNKPTRKNLKKVDNTFFMSNEIHQMVQETILKLENSAKKQIEIDRLWIEIKHMFFNEMGSLPDLPKPNSKKLKQHFRKMQPFWNNELADLWFSACQAEKNYTMFRVFTNADLRHKNNLRQI